VRYMRLAVFTGCFTLVKQIAVEASMLKVIQYFNIEPITPQKINCCGFAFRSIAPNTSIYLTARILAYLNSFESEGILTLCNGCYLMLKETIYRLKENQRLLETIRKHLKDEGIDIKSIPRIIHPIELFHDIIGIETLKNMAYTKQHSISIATHYGCHALRPSTLPSFDNPLNPYKMEKIAEALGFKTKDYPERLDCCGAVLLASKPELAMKLAYSKIAGTARWGFQLLITTCPYCFEMLDSRQEAVMQMFGDEPKLPVMLLTQLIGLQLGLSEKDLALNFNLSPIDRVLPQILRR